MSESSLPLITIEQGSELGLDRSEWLGIVDRLGRAPNEIEAKLFIALWSEEVGFKNSASMLATIEQKFENLKTASGFWGGSVLLPDSCELLAKAVQNNIGFRRNPSAGTINALTAAVGSVASQGAKPLGVSVQLAVGELDKSDSLRRFQQGTAALCQFSLQTGLPELETDWFSHENNIANSMNSAVAIGIRKHQQETISASEGDPLLYVGLPIRREKIARPGETTSKDTGYTDPVDDPFFTYRLAMAFTELGNARLIIGSHWLRYGGLGVGVIKLSQDIKATIDIDLNRLPHRLSTETAEDLLFSESSGRILLVTSKSSHRELVKILASWEIPQVTCGSIIEGRGATFSYNHRMIADIPLQFALSGGSQREFNVVRFPPMLKSAASISRAPTAPKKYKKKEDQEWAIIREATHSKHTSSESFEEPTELEDTWVDMLADINLSSRKQLTESYDDAICGYTITSGNNDGKLLRYETENGRSLLAIATASCPIYTSVDPYLGMAHAIAHAMRKVSALGATPVGMCFVLHYGDPNKYKDVCDLSESIRALRDCSQHWQIPLLDGDISLGNGSDAHPLLPTPVITMIGTRANSDTISPSYFTGELDRVFLIGKTDSEFTCSEYSRYVHQIVDRSGVPNLDFDREFNTASAIAQIVHDNELTTCRALGPGGLGHALGSAALSGDKLRGTTLSVELGNLRKDAQLFSESAGRFLLACKPEREAALKQRLEQSGIPIFAYGEVTGKSIELSGSLHCSLQLSTAYRIWNQASERAFGL